MQAGSLFIELGANVARLAKDLNEAKGLVGGAMSKISDMVGVAKQALAGLGLGLGIAGLAALVKGVTDAVDSLNDLSDATGASVENLSALQDIARRTGTSIETVGSSVIKFNQALGSTMKPGSDAEKVLKSLGLNAKALREMDPAEALLQTAVAMGKFADDGNKARAAQELFGKSLKEVAPFLKDLAEAGKLNATVTTEQALAAERFNKQLFNMQADTEALKREIVMGLVPALSLLLQNFRAIKAMGGLDLILKDSARALFTGDPRMTGDHGADINKGIARRTELERQLSAAQADGRGRHVRTLKEEITTENRYLEVLRAKQANELLAAQAGEVSDAVSRKQQARTSLRIPDEHKLTEALKARQKAEEERMKWGRQDAMRQGDAVTDAIEAEAKATKEATKAIEEFFKARGNQYEADQKVIDSANEILTKIEDETAGLAMSNVERETAIALRELEASKIDKTSEAYLRLKEAIPQAVAAREAAREHKKIWDSIDSTAHDVFVNIFKGGSNAFKKLGQTLKAAVLDLLYQMTVKKWIFQIAGSSEGQGISSMVSGGGTGFLSGIGSLFGGGNGGGILSSVGGLFGMGGSSAAAGAGSLMGGLASVAGPIALGIGLLTTLLKGHGETRSGGAYNMGNFVTGPSGGEIGAAGQASKTTVETINATLAAIGSSSKLTNFFTGVESSEKGKGFAYAGGTLNTGGVFGQGWGDAFSTEAHMNRRGSMTQEQAMAAFTSELKQATLQAIQAATDVPATIAKKLEGLDIDAIADTQVDALLTEINKVITSVDQLRAAAAMLPFENLKKLSFDAAASLIEFSGGIESLISNLNAYYSNFFSGEEQRLQTAKNIKRTLDAAGGTFSLDQILGGSRAQFREVTEAFANRTDEAGMKFYAAMLSVAGAFASITPEMQAASDAGDLYTESLQDQTSALEDTISRFTDFADSLKRFLRELNMGQLAQNSPFEQYQKTAAEFNRLNALDPKNEERLAGLEEAGRAFLEASQAYNASNPAYFADLEKVKAAVQASEIAARAQVDVARLQLNALLAIQDNTSPAAAPASGGSVGAAGGSGGGASFGGSPTTQAGSPGTILTSGGIPFDFIAYINSHLSDPGAIASTAQMYGITQSWIANAMGKNLGDVQAWFSTQGIPAFEFGTNYVDRTGLAWLHEGEAVQPKRYNPAAGGGDNGELLAELKGLRAENQKLNAMFASYAQRDLETGNEIADNTKANAEASTLAMVQPIPIPA
jgi:hypothetical protein